MIRWFTLLAVAVLSSGCYSKAKPSSAIPDRRSFPVNTAVDPCDDFYQYACTDVISTFKLRSDRASHVFSFDDSRERLLSARMKFLSDLATRNPAELSSPLVDMQTVYNSCMASEARSREEHSIVEDTKAEVSRIHDRRAFAKFLAAKLLSPRYSFLSFGVINNFDDSRWDDVILRANILYNLVRRNYEPTPEMDAKERAAIEARKKAYQIVLQSFFETIHVTDAEKRAAAVLNFEYSAAIHYPTAADLRDRYVDRSTLATRSDLLKKYPNLQLGSFVSAIPEKTKFRVVTPETLSFLNDALGEKGEDLETLKDYYLFRSLVSFMDDGYPEFFQTVFAYNFEHLGGAEKRSERSERCTKVLMDEFSPEIDYELLPTVFPKFPKKKLVDTIEKLRSTIADALAENTWLSETSKKEAILKVKTAKIELFSPDRIEDWGFNPDLEYSSDRYYENLMRLSDANEQRTLQELATGHNKTRWGWGPLTVNASSNKQDNRLNFPAGILAYPFFDGAEGVPEYVNLGGIGAVIGHEIGHLFDDKGAKYDHEGNMRDWMPKADLEEFARRGAPIIEQFNAIGHDGRNTQGENIGDLVGVTFAYQAAFPKNDGSLEAKKAFFLQWGRNWCGVMTESFRHRQLTSNSHSLPEARVNMQVIQQPGFYEAYECGARDKMYLAPERRISIW